MFKRAGHRAVAVALVSAGLCAVANAQTMCSLVCPANMILASLPGQMNTGPVNYAAPVPNGCTALAATQTAGLPPGSQFPVGTTTSVFGAMRPDFSYEATCQFTVTVTATPALPVAPTGVPVGGGALVALLALVTAGFGVWFQRRSRAR
ncbi:MAG TPA: HYR domain-containing protein [Casimicrobium sp.]|nr:HYR domain-containing protein [Casimicrobium sp.]